MWNAHWKVCKNMQFFQCCAIIWIQSRTTWNPNQEWHPGLILRSTAVYLSGGSYSWNFSGPPKNRDFAGSQTSTKNYLSALCWASSIVDGGRRFALLCGVLVLGGSNLGSNISAACENCRNIRHTNTITTIWCILEELCTTQPFGFFFGAPKKTNSLPRYLRPTLYNNLVIVGMVFGTDRFFSKLDKRENCQKLLYCLFCISLCSTFNISSAVKWFGVSVRFWWLWLWWASKSHCCFSRSHWMKTQNEDTFCSSWRTSGNKQRYLFLQMKPQLKWLSK